VARNLDSAARVLVFIDGQNAYKSCERLYEHGPTHPMLLADRLREGRRLVGVRYFTGVPNPNIDPDGRKRRDLRHNLMRRTGVTVVERQLRYRWEWGFDSTALPDPMKSRGKTQEVEVWPYQRAREKGIDLAIGLDAIDLALTGYMDVAIIVSSDNDLCEAARMVHQATIAKKSRVSVEAALFSDAKKPILLKYYDHTRQLRRGDFEAAKDSFDYGAPLDPQMEALFAATCLPLRKHFGPRGG
jgi:uncharacterized LabA/DUF88 family protein